MSWDGFKHILGNYPGIKVKFNQRAVSTIFLD